MKRTLDCLGSSNNETWALKLMGSCATALRKSGPLLVTGCASRVVTQKLGITEVTLLNMMQDESCTLGFNVVHAVCMHVSKTTF